MRYIRLFNESLEEINTLDDFLLEYLDKWKLLDEDRYSSLPFYDKSNYNGTYKIEKVSSKYFDVTGFPSGESGYRIKICFTKEFNEKDFKIDMNKFINRICKMGYNYDTFHDKYGDKVNKFYIAFYK